MKKMRKKSGFRIGTFAGLALLFFIGLGLMIFGYTVCQENSIKEEIFLFLGETFIGAAILSVIMELHSIQDNYKKVRDYLLLEEPSFIERYNEKEVDRIIELGIKQKIRLRSDKNLDEDIFNRLISGKNFFLEPYIEHTANELGKNGFYCNYHRRQINIKPINNEEYIIRITLEIELRNFTKEKISFEQEYKFYYISQKQIDSFSIKYLEIDQKSNLSAANSLRKYTDDKPSTSRHPFTYIVEFSIPVLIEAKSHTHYILEYEYKNYEQACYITYSLPYITKSFLETYSLIGENSHEYQLHASAYTPYKKEIDNRNLVQRQNNETLSINSNNWIMPGSGFVAIIRKNVS